MKIIYRVYEKGEGGTGFYGNYDNILNQEVCFCNSRDHFKEIMRSMYGEDIAFKNSKKLPLGTPYIVIISENCHDAEEYVSVMDYTCSCCGKQFKSIPKSLKKIHSTWEFDRLNHNLFLSRQNEIENMVFCSSSCQEKKVGEIKQEFERYNEKNDIVPEFYVDRNTFSSYNQYGYIYKITKRSTGEFYIGQTKYNPIFRWGQHLTTDRFHVKNIMDYIFEVIDVVTWENREQLLAKEAYWINHERDKCPEKCLNNQIPKEEDWKEKLENVLHQEKIDV